MLSLFYDVITVLDLRWFKVIWDDLINKHRNLDGCCLSRFVIGTDGYASGRAYETTHARHHFVSGTCVLNMLEMWFISNNHLVSYGNPKVQRLVAVFWCVGSFCAAWWTMVHFLCLGRFQCPKWYIYTNAWEIMLKRSSLGPLFRSFCVEFTKNTVYCGSRSTAIQRLLSIKFVSQRILGQTPQIISMDEVCKGISPQTTLDMLRITV